MLLRMIRPFSETTYVAKVVLRVFVVMRLRMKRRAALGAVFRGNAIRHRYLLAVRRMRLVSYRLTPCDYILDLACAHLRSLKAFFLPKYTRLLRYQIGRASCRE